MSGAIIPLIMCGGAGTRLWPASREDRPKQFLRIFGKLSSFQETLLRVCDGDVFSRPIVITNERYRFLVAEQLSEIGVEADILLEPLRRNSAPAIAAGSTFALARGGDSAILALAADHLVTDNQAFVAACQEARGAVESGKIVAFGVRPDRPAIEYGYIRPGRRLGASAIAIDEFVEKPDGETARRYVADGYLWNSGNVMFLANILLDEYRAFEPESAEAVVQSVMQAGSDLGFITLDAQAFAKARDISIDYAVLERTRHAAVIPVSYEWSDIGSWQAVWSLAEKDADHNAARGSAVFVDAKGSYVSTEKALVGLFGVQDLVVVASDDAILIAGRDHAGDLKKLVEQLKVVSPELTQQHAMVYRPWGSYVSLDKGDRYQVKRIIVKPSGRLSLQKHHHRAEHWVVVRGTAQVTIGNEVKTLHENESTYIPIGAPHRLENPGKIDLELIEVQSGSYLGEDDIIRFDDDYHRS